MCEEKKKYGFRQFNDICSEGDCQFIFTFSSNITLLWELPPTHERGPLNSAGCIVPRVLIRWGTPVPNYSFSGLQTLTVGTE